MSLSHVTSCTALAEEHTSHLYISTWRTCKSLANITCTTLLVEHIIHSLFDKSLHLHISMYLENMWLTRANSLVQLCKSLAQATSATRSREHASHSRKSLVQLYLGEHAIHSCKSIADLYLEKVRVTCKTLAGLHARHSLMSHEQLTRASELHVPQVKLYTWIARVTSMFCR